MRIIGLEVKHKSNDKTVMLYGKRILEPQRAIQRKGHRKLIVNGAFQSKYVTFLAIAVGGSALLFFLPAIFFIRQNYELFSRLAYDTAPSLVNHLDREVHWLTIFMGLSLVSICTITFVMGYKVTRNLLSPLVSMEKHMRQLMMGNWSVVDFEVPEEEDYKDLSITYDYLYRSLKANTEVELDLLERLAVDPQNREAHAAWTQLITLKRERLGMPTTTFDATESASKSGAVVELRRVS